MKLFGSSMRSLTIIALSAGLPFPSAAQAPSEVSDLVGARGAGGETQLQARGYRFIRTQTGDDRKWSFWWNADRRQCLSVTTVDGRYQSILATPAPDCGEQTDGGNDRARNGGDRARGDGGYHPDLGYRRPPSNNREGPSYARPEGEARTDGGYAEVGGQQVQLGLVCFGDGQRPGVANTYGWSWNADKDRYDYGNRVEMTAQQFDASVMIQLWPNGGRIKLPKKLIPPIHSRGSEDGWWDVYNISMQPDQISGEYRLNGLNKPRITINRTSGQISIIGTATYAFRGSCDLIDGKDHRRF